MPTQPTEDSKALQPSDENTSPSPQVAEPTRNTLARNSFREMVASGHSYRTNVTNPRMFHSQMTWASGVLMVLSLSTLSTPSTLINRANLGAEMSKKQCKL